MLRTSSTTCLAPAACRRVLAERALAPLGDRRDVAVALRIDRAPEAAEVRRARIAHGKSRHSSSRPISTLSPSMNASMKRWFGSSSATLSAGTRLETGQQPILRQRASGSDIGCVNTGEPPSGPTSRRRASMPRDADRRRHAQLSAGAGSSSARTCGAPCRVERGASK